MLSRTEFQRLLRATLFPVLRSHDFKCRGTGGVRVVNNRIDAINVQGNRYGGSYCVELGVHYTFLPDAVGRPVSDATKMDAYDCEFRRRLSDPGKDDCWWSYGYSEAEGARQIADMAGLFEREGLPFFEKFGLETIANWMTPQRIETNDLPEIDIPTAVRTALILAKIMKHFGKDDLRRQYASAGIRIFGPPGPLLAELEELAC
jgi:hypothetical protein